MTKLLKVCIIIVAVVTTAFILISFLQFISTFWANEVPMR